MRLLVWSQYFWPEIFRINDIAKSLIHQGVELEVLTGKPNYPRGKILPNYRAWGCQQEVYLGININRIPLIARNSGGWMLALNYLSFLFSGLFFAPRMLRKKKFDVIFVYGLSPVTQAIPAIFIGWLKGIPVVLWVQDLWPESLSATGYIRNKFVISIIRKIVSYIYDHVDLLLVQSRAFIDPVRALTSDTPIIYYPNSVDSSFFELTPTEPPHVDGLDARFSVMFAGNIGSAQAVEVIVEAAWLLRGRSDIHFVVLGDGSTRKWMLEQAQLRGLSNLHLPGQFPVETMPGFMQKASALLVTLADQSIFAATVPNKVQAYMASGRPIIACLNGEGARLVLEAKAGLVSPAENAEALADTILQLYNMSPLDRKLMGDNGRRYYSEHFNHDILVAQLIEHLQAVSKSRKGNK